MNQNFESILILHKVNYERIRVFVPPFGFKSLPKEVMSLLFVIVSCQFADQFYTLFSAVWNSNGFQDNRLMSFAYTNTLLSSTFIIWVFEGLQDNSLMLCA